MNSSDDFHENSFSRFDKFLRLVAQIIASNFEPEYTRARSTAKPSAAEYDSSVVYRGCHVSAEMTSEDKQSKVMSETDYQQLIERMLENAASPTISSDTGVEAAQKVGELAAQEEIEWAVAGGLAMYFYGSPRLTKDVDIIASQSLANITIRNNDKKTVRCDHGYSAPGECIVKALCRQFHYGRG